VYPQGQTTEPALKLFGNQVGLHWKNRTMCYESFQSPVRARRPSDEYETTTAASSGCRLFGSFAMLSAGKDEAAVPQALEVTQSTYDRWRKQYGRMKAEEARRLNELEDKNRRPKQIVANHTLDIEMLKHINQGNW
jgi:hypothetical protein